MEDKIVPHVFLAKEVYRQDLLKIFTFFCNCSNSNFLCMVGYLDMSFHPFEEWDCGKGEYHFTARSVHNGELLAALVLNFLCMVGYELKSNTTSDIQRYDSWLDQ